MPHDHCETNVHSSTAQLRDESSSCRCNIILFALKLKERCYGDLMIESTTAEGAGRNRNTTCAPPARRRRCRPLRSAPSVDTDVTRPRSSWVAVWLLHHAPVTFRTFSNRRVAGTRGVLQTLPHAQRPGRGGRERRNRQTEERASSFVSCSVRPSGNAAVAKKSATVKPIAVVRPTTSRSRRSRPAGSGKPAAVDTLDERMIPSGFRSESRSGPPTYRGRCSRKERPRFLDRSAVSL
jgi:hypothetical protein